MELQDFDALHNVSPGKHFYQFYKTSEDYLRVVTNFLRAGLEKKEACLWLISKKTGFQQALAAAALTIPGFEIYLRTGQLGILSGEEWYLTRGHFDQEKTVSNVVRYLENIQKKGYPVLRGTGDAQAIPRADWQKVREYERLLSSWIKSRPVIGLCAYPIHECTLDETRSVLECHDDVLVGHL